jgi:hypothetical protein
MRTRGVVASTVARSRRTAGPSAVGSAPGLGSTIWRPSSILVDGACAVGKKRSDSALQPNSTMADRTIARIMLR